MTPRRIDDAELARKTALAAELPFLRRCGFTLEGQTDGGARGRVTVTAELAGPSGQLNGTELYGLLDCTAWFAVATTLGPDEAAVTHDAHFAILSAAPVGAEVVFEATVVKRGRTTAFVRVDARDGERTIALATITKTVLPLAVRQRHAARDSGPST